jgi:homopolymeric O-antigen transport system ATP-binding protein
MKTDIIYQMNNVGLCYRKAATLPWKANKFWALHDVSFHVCKGDTLGIIGRNGAGKSSLLKIMAGIVEPDAGNIQRAKVKASILNFGSGFNARLTGKQNIVLNGILLGMSKSFIKSKFDDIINLADIGEFINQPVHTYSTGMQARLGFAVNYFLDTDVLLIDEVLSTGDQRFMEKTQSLIKQKINSDLTVIIVSHDLNLIQELCHRVIQIEDGHSLPELSQRETIDRYLNTECI